MSITIIDSSLTREEVLKQNPTFHCPDDILDQIVILDVDYYSFDDQIHTGQIAINEELADDVRGAFEVLLEERFPLQSVIPISADSFRWEDDLSTPANNTSGFNYRYVRDTKILSYHSLGRAIDINPLLNPYFPGELVYPSHATYIPTVPGTILEGSRLVLYFEKLGWRWGGNWDEDKDYQHFEKLGQ